jgi:amino acid permease
LKKKSDAIHVYEATAILMGAIIGAGVLGIPYVMMQAGFLTGMLVLLLIGAVVIVVNMCVGEITLRTKGLHQLTGYVGIYLGERGKRLMTIAMILGNYGALLAYTIGEGRSLAEIFGGNPWLWSAGFFVVGSIILYLGLNAVGASELILNIIKFGAFGTVFLLMVSSFLFEPSHLSGFDITSLFVPYGVILFACLGAIAIPEMREELSGNLKHLKKAIFIGTLVPILVYALFSIAVVGVTGALTTEVANIGIGRLMGFIPLVLVNIFAILAMATSFIALGFGLKEMFEEDYGMKKIWAFLLTITVPVILILLGIHSFIAILGITGALAGGLEGILLLLTYWKARKHGQRKPEYELKLGLIPIILMIAVFIIGAIITIREAVL